MVTAIWLRIGFNMVIYLAGLQSVSPELYEAARLDGAGAVAAFRSITRAARVTVDVLPADHERHRVVPVFDIVFVMTGAARPGSRRPFWARTRTATASNPRAGYGAALGVVILLITLVFTYIQWRTSRSRDTVE